MTKKTVPIFYACDDTFASYTVVSLSSIIKNASREYNYRVYILYSAISDEMRSAITELSNDLFEISFVDVSEYLESISDKLPIRDYYSKTTYYRLFIAEMFSEYDKVVYIDSDTVVPGDISELYNIDIGDSYVGACHEQAMIQNDTFGTYAEKVVGVSRYNFFNAGVMLMNCRLFREKNVLMQFIKYLGEYNFVVTQDEDYLNLICKDHVYWLDSAWNTEVFGEVAIPAEEIKILHYIMTSKPWHYSDCRYGDVFWSYAKDTSVYEQILEELNAYTDEKKEKDLISAQRLEALAAEEIAREDNFLNRQNLKRDPERVALIKKMEEYEKAGTFDKDVEDDPPGKVLMPDDIDYLKKGFFDRIKTKIAYRRARKFVYGLLDDKKMIVKGIEGLENLKNLDTGAIITCNHFNAFDSFAVQILYEASGQNKKRTFYRVIKEGNYTSFPGFYGFLMRNCNTLPLSSNHRTMKKFKDSVDLLLKEGNLILVYPEQSMWWNYRKPKPLKRGAFSFAVNSDVPVLPCFITMKDSDVLGEDGFFVQEYKIHVSAPIYPDKALDYNERVEKMQKENFEVWKNIYEKEYSMPLVYLTKE